MIPERFNLASALVERRRVAADRTPWTLDCDGRVWTLDDVVDAVHRAGNGLRSLGVAPGQRVLIVLPDSCEFVAAFLGAVAIGAVAVPCSTFLSAADCGYFLRETGAPVLLTTKELLARIEPAVAAAPGLQAVVMDSEVFGGASPNLVAADTHRDDPAFWLWTSGSTGEPKAAVHRHQDAPWCCTSFAEDVLGLRAGDRVFSAAKLFHAYGLGNSLFFPLWCGAGAVLHSSRAMAEAVFARIDQTRPTVFFGVPTLYAAMLKHAADVPRGGLPSVRHCVSAAEPLPPEIFARWRDRFGIEILDAIGSTEMLNTYMCARPGRIRPGSTGTPLRGYEVRIVDEHGAAVAVHQIGELLVKGPSRASHYWNRPDQTQQFMRGDWFVSGDKYSVDEDGYHWYEGRSDDMFKVSGEWLSPAEIEALLMAHPAVLECAVVAWHDAAGLLKPKAYVVLKDGGQGSDAFVLELQEFVRARTAHYKYPRAIEFMTELPKTPTGKIQRFKLRT